MAWQFKWRSACRCGLCRVADTVLCDQRAGDSWNCHGNGRGAEPLTCCSRVLHMLCVVMPNSFFASLILPWIDGTLADGMQDGHQLLILRARLLFLTCAYRLEALLTLRAMERTRIRVLLALRAQFLRDRSSTVCVPRPFIAVWRLKTDMGPRRSGPKESIHSVLKG